MRRLIKYRQISVAMLAPLIIASALAVDQIAWVKSMDVARKQAAKEKKFIVLDISASW